MEAPTLYQRVRFGNFEVDPESGELFKDGCRVRLRGQPVQVLLMLLERPGRLVTREELQQRLGGGMELERGRNSSSVSGPRIPLSTLTTA